MRGAALGELATAWAELLSRPRGCFWRARSGAGWRRRGRGGGPEVTDRLLRKLIAGAGAGAYGLGDSLFSAEGERCEHWHVFTRPLAGNGSVALIEKQYLVIMNRGSFSDCGGP